MSQTSLNALMVIQLSDIHYGDDSNHDHEAQFRKMISLEVIPKILEAIKRQEPNCILIVLNGDYSNHRSRRELVSQIQLSIEKSLLPIEDAVKNVRPKVKVVRVVVPGNHDVDRSIESKSFDHTLAVEVSDRRLKAFYSAVDEINKTRDNRDVLHTPDKGPIQIGLEKLNVIVWPIDSAYRCGALTSKDDGISNIVTDDVDPDKLVVPAKLDLLRVRKGQIEDCQDFLQRYCSENENSLRIAVLHHSPVAATSRREAHIFEDAGSFIEFLLENRFNILLHGHNHETSVIPIGEIGLSQANDEGWSAPIKNQISRPFLESAVTCVGARSLWPGAEPEKGFNILTFSQIDRSYLLHTLLQEVSISSHRLSSSKRRGVSHVEELSFYMTSRSLSSLSEPDARRQSILRGVTNNYSDVRVSEYDRESTLSESALMNLRRSRDAFRNHSVTHAAYAINNILPSDWINSGFLEAISPYASINVLRGQKFAVEESDEVCMSHLEKKYRFRFPVFQYSKWLCDAVSHCCDLASKIGVSDRLDEYFEKKGKDFPNCLSSFSFLRHSEMLSIWRSQRRFIDLVDEGVRGAHSLSYWASASAGGRVLHSPVQFDLTRMEEDEFDGHRQEISSLHEFPRLLLWSSSEFRKPSAFKVIDFHEQNGIPLFWLDPARLRSRAAGVMRSDIGASEYFGQHRNQKMVRSTGFNNRDGEHPSSNCFNVANPFAVDLPARLWGFDEDEMEHLGPRSFRRSSPAEEFRVLCARPDLLLAVDAWFLVKTIGERGLAEHLDKLESDVDTWLNRDDF